MLDLAPFRGFSYHDACAMPARPRPRASAHAVILVPCDRPHEGMTPSLVLLTPSQQGMITPRTPRISPDPPTTAMASQGQILLPLLRLLHLLKRRPRGLGGGSRGSFQ